MPRDEFLFHGRRRSRGHVGVEVQPVLHKRYLWIAMGVAFGFALQVPAQNAPPPGPPPGVSSTQPSIPLDQAAADRFSGYYQTGPQRAVRYWREGEHFYFGTVGTPQQAEVVPLAPNQFSFANGLVTFAFNSSANGTFVLTINQAGREITAPRIDEALAKSFSAATNAQAPKASVPRTWPVLSGVTIKTLTTPMTGTMDYWPCLSPDGKTVLFSRTLDGGMTWALFKVPAAGGAAQPFGSLPVSAIQASWSKTGRIAFNGYTRDGKGAIWVIDAKGRNARAIATEGVLISSYPSWYPDGATIGFGDAARNILYRVSAEGGTPTSITHQDQVLSGMSSVSPDGQWMAFAGQKNDGQVYNQNSNQIWLVDGRGDARTVEAQPLQGRTPSWSPDGKKLAFESNRGSPNEFLAIFIINRDGSGLIQVTDYALNASHPVFSPDGRHLVFATGDPAQKSATIALLTLPASP